ncbi:uncharacterized protein [Dermacentor albipictus]|uniref:uncharacterized protein n=1 Tax=Dermacentor albipictus TaxID=60249 RepID=UPI0031FBAA8E
MEREFTFISAVLLATAGTTSAVAGARCHFSDVDLDALVSDMLDKMPEEWAMQPGFTKTLIPGVEIGGANVTGLHLLRRYGPLLPYCDNGTRMIHFDLVNRGGGIQISFPWQLFCSGNGGIVGLAVGFTRITVPLRIDGSGTDAKLSLEGPVTPVAIEGIHLRLTGAGTQLEEAFAMIGKLAPTHQREEWNRLFFTTMYDVFGKTLD